MRNPRPASRSGATRCRCSATSNIRPTSSASTTSIRMRPRAASPARSLIGTFDNFNIAVAGVKGSLAAAVQLVYESLMTSSLDEVSTEYGALAEAVSHPDDFSSVTYRLRAQAKWHDGKPVTADDVIFSLDAFKKYHPQYSAYYRHVVKAEKTRRSRNQVHLRCAGQSRTSADRGPAHGIAEALVGGHRQRRPQARHLRDDAGEAAGLRSLSHQGIRRRTVGHRWSG